MISKADVISDLLKEYETYTRLREKLAIQLEALGVDVYTRENGAQLQPTNEFRVPPKAN